MKNLKAYFAECLGTFVLVFFACGVAALTGNLVDLKDPQVQTNAILAQILVVVSSIMNQNNNVASTVSLSDALSGLALGLTTSTPFDQTPTVS